MKRKELWRKLSWVLTAGLVISNPAYLHAKELEETTVQTETETVQTETTTDAPAQTEQDSETETVQTETADRETESQETETAMSESETTGQTEEETKAEEEEEKRKKPSATPDTQKDTESGDGQGTESNEDTESGETQRSSGEENGNSQLIAGQTIYHVEQIEEDFRFVTVEEEVAIAREDLEIYEEQDEDSRAVGSLQEDGICYVLKQEDGWAYVESGVVRGFVREDRLFLDAQAKQRLAQLQGRTSSMSLAFPVDHLNKSAQTLQEEFTSYTVDVETLEEDSEYTQDWNCLNYAKPLVDPIENKALAYTRTTTRETVAGKIYAIAQKSEVKVYGSMEPDEKKVAGTLEKGALCYILADEKSDMIYIESGDVRGFVKADQIMTGEEASKLVEEKGEESFALAQQKMEPEENPVLYYTLTSIKEGRIASAIRTSMVKFATSFIGNPYVWGGTSLTQGADCSGFVQSIYAQYGYSIPRVAADQAQYGKKIQVSDAQPGDLIFYARDGEIYHVVMYIGDGKVVEAAGTGIGIIISNVNTEGAVWATSIISDADEEIIRKVNQKSASYVTAKEEDIGEYLGKFKLTSYCTCAVCCGQWANGVTASGAMPTEGRTVAMAGVPFGTRLVIGGQIYVVEDRGTPYGHVDIFKNVHEECSQFGVQYADVYLAK